MIAVTRLNGSVVTINAELIESMESAPNQTVIHLATNNRYVVRESVDELVAKVIEYRRKVNSESKAVNPIKGFERT
ncbi:MAG: flagellar FlbD family protein [Elusimicrobia bacterium]|nr:flagellar FlbD family protein [Elusimicrobiota bacterium]